MTLPWIPRSLNECTCMVHRIKGGGKNLIKTNKKRVNNYFFFLCIQLIDKDLNFGSPSSSILDITVLQRPLFGSKKLKPMNLLDILLLHDVCLGLSSQNQIFIYDCNYLTNMQLIVFHTLLVYYKSTGKISYPKSQVEVWNKSLEEASYS